ncbi:MAG: mitochondrial fission ELM1 family protein [Alphaproteobacteria bacterium]|nr:mitochondrial fission ELM1 family protein [Alphaproteobacteria bacterium]
MQNFLAIFTIKHNIDNNKPIQQSECVMVKTIWSLMDDRRGSVGQAKGVLNALNPQEFEIVEKTINYNKFAGLPNWLRGRSLLGLKSESKLQLRAPFPDYVLSISRRTAPVARYIKKHSPHTKIIQLMHPGNTGLEDFDLVIVPEHDKNKKSGANIHYIVGCPHRVDDKYLAAARAEWAEKFAKLPKPLTAVIIGGSIKGKPFPPEDVSELCRNIKRLKQKIGGSILITTSRRTGIEAENIIKKELVDLPQYPYFWGSAGDNPYAGFLACADNIVITADSVSMCCESTGTGKPIYLFVGGNHWLTPKHKRFAQSLVDKKCAIFIDAPDIFEFQPQSALNAAKEVAELIENL